jgi:hypothetical protein
VKPAGRKWTLTPVFRTPVFLFLIFFLCQPSLAQQIHPTECREDSSATIDSHIAAGEFGSKYVPKGTRILRGKGRYKIVRPTGIYIYPRSEKKFAIANITCPIASCGQAIKSMCSVLDENDVEWIVDMFKDGVLYYVHASDVVKQ